MRAIMSKRVKQRLSTKQGRLEVAQEVNQRMQERRLRVIKEQAGYHSQTTNKTLVTE